MREVELKFRVADHDGVIARLQELGCQLSQPITQHDQNFVHRDDTNWFVPGYHGYNYPRLRIQGDRYIFTVKKPLLDGVDNLDCLESEIRLQSQSDADQIPAMMALFDYVPGVTVHKVRQKCVYQDYEIVCDVVDDLGTFIEIESLIADDGDAAAVQSFMIDFAVNQLGLDNNDRTTNGYDILMHEYLVQNN